MVSEAMIAAFEPDDDTEPYDEFCVGNSHALIVRDITDTTAQCACGGVITKISDSPERYAHADGKIMCPAYDCPCGQQHNAPPQRP